MSKTDVYGKISANLVTWLVIFIHQVKFITKNCAVDINLLFLVLIRWTKLSLVLEACLKYEKRLKRDQRLIKKSHRDQEFRWKSHPSWQNIWSSPLKKKSEYVAAFSIKTLECSKHMKFVGAAKMLCATKSFPVDFYICQRPMVNPTLDRRFCVKQC